MGLINSRQIKLSVVAGSCNPADIGTKRLSCARLRSLMCLPGMYNLSTAAVEGADDPGGIMTKKTNMLTMLSALSLFQKGCDGEFDPDTQPSLAMVVFTAAFGFMFLLACCFYSSAQQQVTEQFGPDAEPDASAISNPAMHDDDIDMSVAAEAEPEPQREPNAEDYMTWPVERCERRRASTEDADRRSLQKKQPFLLRPLRSDE